MSKKYNASFRNVEFCIDSYDEPVGRRTILFEYPKKDIPFTEDMGRRAYTYSLQCHVVGDDYRDQIDKIKDACNKEGPGILSYDVFGDLEVMCPECVITGTNTEKKYIKFTLSFQERGKKEFPKEETDAILSMMQKAIAVRSQAGSLLEKAFSITGQVESVIDKAVDLVDTAADAIDAIKPTGLMRIAKKIAAFSAAVSELKAKARELAATPSRLRAQFEASFNLLGESFGLNPKENNTREQNKMQNNIAEANRYNSEDRKTYDNLLTYGDDLTDIEELTPAREQESLNQKTMKVYMKSMAVSYLAEKAVESGFSTSNDANNAREKLVDDIDAILEITEDDETFQALQELQKQAQIGIPDPNKQLPSIKKIVLPETTPSIVLAYRLYGNNDLEGDILLRNMIQNPAYIVGGNEIEVISGG